MKSKTGELTRLALRWAVAKAEELDVFIPAFASTPWLQIRNNGIEMMCPNWDENWTHGGPIIEREWLCVDRLMDGRWCAAKRTDNGDSMLHMQLGPTPLIAAMRCFVVSKLGDEVDIPEELK
jgi:hypothetical protein